MRISVFGLGYVGAVTMGCLARQGHHVVGVDVNPQKVETLNRGQSPIVEPGLGALLAAARAGGTLSATTHHEAAVADTELSIICVGTPSLPSGDLNLAHVQHVAGQIAAALQRTGKRHHIVIRSTMLPGSTAALAKHLFPMDTVDVLFFPEFLREGTAVADFDHPALAVVGTRDGKAAPAAVLDLIGPATPVTNWETAEMLKYACNAFHATKVAFANEMGRIGKNTGVNAQRVMELFCQDRTLNLSPYYLRPGNPFGGSCLPKDVQALQAFAARAGVKAPLLDSLMTSNREHVQALIAAIHQSRQKEVVVLGLSFKADTDDLRGSAMVEVVRDLIPSGRTVRIFDPHLHPDQLLGANMQIILDKLPVFTSLLCRDLGEAVGERGLIVAAQRCVGITALARHVTPQHHILDVNGWAELRQLAGSYEGFCW